MARPRKMTPDTVKQGIDNIIRKYQDTQDVFYLSDYYVMETLGVSKRTLDRYYSGEADQMLQDDNNIPEEERERYKESGYGTALKRLVEFRSAICQQQMVQGKNLPGWIFLSKQGRYGGFQDIQRGEQTVKADFRVTLTGPDGKTISG